MSVSTPRPVYPFTPGCAMFKTYEVVAEGKRAETPVRDKVYVDVDSRTVVGVHPQIHSGLNRSVYTASNGTSLPGTLRRGEGQLENPDLDVNAAYDATGDTYNAYRNFWNRNSYDNAGAALKSTVHFPGRVVLGTAAGRPDPPEWRPVTGISGATNNAKYWKITPARAGCSRSRSAAVPVTPIRPTPASLFVVRSSDR